MASAIKQMCERSEHDNTMKFRTRETTDYCFVVMKDTGGLSVQELQREAMRSGLLALGYHFVIQQNGDTEPGREATVVAGHDLKDPEISFYILMDAGTTGKLTDAQKVALKDLKLSVQKEYPDIQFRTVK